MQDLARALAPVPGFQGAALGGSYARGQARAGSDIDLGVYYSAASPLSIPAIREVAAGFPGSLDPTVSELYEWGPWVNGGAWLRIQGQRVDLIYRSLEQLECVIGDAEQGRYELHFGQQPPFGYFGPTYLGELAIAVPLLDPSGHIARLKGRVAEYPEALRRRVVQDSLWSVEFALRAFAPKFARQGDVYLTASTLARCVHALLLALFALSRRHLVNDKTALLEASALPLGPPDLRGRVERVLSRVGSSVAELERSVALVAALFGDVAALAGPLYLPKYELSKVAL